MSENATPQAAMPKVPYIKQTMMVGLAFFTIGLFWQVYDSLMPLFLKNFPQFNTALIGLVMAGDNILALILLPFMGRLSDRTRSRFGRRVPYIVVGAVLAAICLLLVNIVHNMNEANPGAPALVVFLMISTIFLLLFMCMYRTPAVSLMPDVTPKFVRSKANAVINIMGAFGGMLALVLMMLFNNKSGPDAEGAYTIGYGNWAVIVPVAVLMVVAVVVMFLTVHENALVVFLMIST
ncbi:MAG: MFS transporter, partial [Clostridiales bacterium]|nr:MFS transporter [Clostridiales bacterium]